MQLGFSGVGLLGLVFTIALCVHVVRSGQNMIWLYLILFVPVLGGLVYLIAVVGPLVHCGTTTAIR